MYGILIPLFIANYPGNDYWWVPISLLSVVAIGLITYFWYLKDVLYNWSTASIWLQVQRRAVACVAGRAMRCGGRLSSISPPACSTRLQPPLRNPPPLYMSPAPHFTPAPHSLWSERMWDAKFESIPPIPFPSPPPWERPEVADGRSVRGTRK